MTDIAEITQRDRENQRICRKFEVLNTPCLLKDLELAKATYL